MRPPKKADGQRAPFLFHVSTNVFIAALRSAQRQRMTISTFVDAALTSACSEAAQDVAKGLHKRDESVSLFLTVASTSPERLTGPWRHLYYQIKQDPALWRTDRITLGELEDGMPPGADFIDAAALEKAWPQLVSNSFPD